MKPGKVLFVFLAICLLALMAPLFAAPKAEAPIHTSEAEKSSTALNKAAPEENGMFAIDPKIFIAQAVNFFLLLWLLNHLIFVPLGKIVAARQEQISADLLNAELERKKAESYRSDWEQKMETVDQESYLLRQKAIGEANSARDQILTEAKALAALKRLAAEKDVLLMKQKAWVELREEVVQLSLAVAEKVIEKSLDDEAHHALIWKTIDQLEKTK